MAIDREQQERPFLQTAEVLASIRTAIAGVLLEHSVELADLVWTTERSALTLRATIERPLPEGTPWHPELGFGVNLDDCADVSRGISEALDALDDVMPEAYALEVSSPGLDRSLHGTRDFARFTGSLVKVKLRNPASDGQRLLRGKLVAAPVGTIAVLVDGKRITAPLDEVVFANLVFEMPKGEKSTPAKGPRRAPSARGPKTSSESANPTSGQEPRFGGAQRRSPGLGGSSTS